MNGNWFVIVRRECMKETNSTVGTPGVHKKHLQDSADT